LYFDKNNLAFSWNKTADLAEQWKWIIETLNDLPLCVT